MKLRSAIDLLSLSSNLYLILKDKEMIEHVKSLVDKGKQKLNEGIDEEFGETEFLEKILVKAKEIRHEFEERVKEEVSKVLDKAGVARKEELSMLNAKIEALEKRINLMEAQILKSGQ